MGRYPSDSMQKCLALCGILGPVVYTIVLLTLAAMQPEYSHVRDFMSELGAAGAPHGPVMQFAGFSLLGVFVVLFSIALYRGTKKTMASAIAVALIALGGAFMISVGFFPCDAGCENVSFTGRMHSLTATIPAIAIPAGIMLLSFAMKKDGRWKGKWSKITLIAGAAAIILSPLAMLPALEPVAGLVQRMGMGVPVAWMVAISTRLYALTKSK